MITLLYIRKLIDFYEENMFKIYALSYLYYILFITQVCQNNYI